MWDPEPQVQTFRRRQTDCPVHRLRRHHQSRRPRHRHRGGQLSLLVIPTWQFPSSSVASISERPHWRSLLGGQGDRPRFVGRCTVQACPPRPVACVVRRFVHPRRGSRSCKRPACPSRLIQGTEWPVSISQDWRASKKRDKSTTITILTSSSEAPLMVTKFRTISSRSGTSAMVVRSYVRGRK